MTFRALCITVRLRRKNYKVYGKRLIVSSVLLYSHKQECSVAWKKKHLLQNTKYMKRWLTAVLWSVVTYSMYCCTNVILAGSYCCTDFVFL